MKLSHEEDPETKLALLREVAALYEGRVRDPQKAFERYLAAFAIAPGDEQARTDAERAAKVTGEWERVIERVPQGYRARTRATSSWRMRCGCAWGASSSPR